MNRELLYYKFARLYDDFYSNRDYKPETDFLIKIFKQVKAKKILDVGCGLGRHTKKLLEKGFEIVGVDLSKEMIAQCKSSIPDAKFFVMDMAKMPLKQNFDAGFCVFSAVLYNVSNKQFKDTLKCFNNSLKKGGIFVICFSTPLQVNNWRETIKGKNFKIVKKERFDYATQKIYSANKYFKNEKYLGMDFSVKRILFPQEAVYFATQAGFSVKEVKIKKTNYGLLTLLVLKKGLK